MSEAKDKLRIGDHVSFLRSHDRLELTGTITNIHDDADLVDIDCDVDGKLVCVEHAETTHAADVTVLEKATHGSESYAEIQARVEREHLVRVDPPAPVVDPPPAAPVVDPPPPVVNQAAPDQAAAPADTQEAAKAAS